MVPAATLETVARFLELYHEDREQGLPARCSEAAEKLSRAQAAHAYSAREATNSEIALQQAQEAMKSAQRLEASVRASLDAVVKAEEAARLELALGPGVGRGAAWAQCVGGQISLGNLLKLLVVWAPCSPCIPGPGRVHSARMYRRSFPVSAQVCDGFLNHRRQPTFWRLTASWTSPVRGCFSVLRVRSR